LPNFLFARKLLLDARRIEENHKSCESKTLLSPKDWRRMLVVNGAMIAPECSSDAQEGQAMEPGKRSIMSREELGRRLAAATRRIAGEVEVCTVHKITKKNGVCAGCVADARKRR
jgi:hypothetical protein